MITVIIGAIGFLWFLAPLLMYGSLNLGNLTGMISFAAVIIYGVKGKAVKNRLSQIKGTHIEKRLYKFAALFFVVLAALLISETGLMIGSCVDKPSKNATAVVLGCRVMPGEKPSLMLAERLDAAYEYLEENPEASCILSGGKGKDEEISEAECMYRYLIERGISPDRLYKEDSSTSTRENLEFSKEIIDREKLPEEIAIITNDFHEYRAGLVARGLGINHSAVPAHTALWLLPTYYVRELYGIIYEWIF